MQSYNKTIKIIKSPPKDSKDNFFKFLINQPNKAPGQEVKGVPVAEIPHLNEYFFEFLKAKEVYKFGVTSRELRNQTQTYRLKAVVTALAKFNDAENSKLANDKKVNFDKSASLENQFKELVHKLKDKLISHLSDVAKSKDLPPLLVAQLLKPTYLRNLFPVSIQMLLENIDKKLQTLFNEEINKTKPEESKLISYLHAGVNNKDAGRYITICIKKQLMQTCLILMTDKSIHIDEIPPLVLSDGVTSVINSPAVNTAKVNLVLDLFKRLCEKGYRARDIYQILCKSHGYRTVGQLVETVANGEPLSEKYYNLIIYLYNNNISIVDLIALIGEPVFFNALTERSSAEKIDKYLYFFIQALQKSPTSSVIYSIVTALLSGNDVFTAPIPTASNLAAINISAREKDFSGTTLTYLQLLREILRVTHDTAIIYAILKAQIRTGWNLGMSIARHQDEKVFKEYCDFIIDLLNNDFNKNNDEKDNASNLNRQNALLSVMQLFELKNDNGDTVASIVAKSESELKINQHFQFLSLLLSKGVSPDQIISYLSVHGDNLSVFGHHLGYTKSSGVKTYLLLLMDLLKAGASAKNIYNLLILQSRNMTQALIYANNLKNSEVDLYHDLLGQLMIKGVTPIEVLSLFRLHTDFNFTYHHILALNQNVASVKQYQDILLKILEDKSLSTEVFNVIKIQNKYLTTFGHCLASHQNDEVLLQHYHLLLTLLNNGVSLADILNYLSIESKNGFNIGTLIAKHKTGIEINSYVKLLMTLLQKGALANSIYLMLKLKAEKGWDFFSLALRKDSFDLQQYFNLLAELEKKVSAENHPVELLKTQLKFSSFVSDAKEPCAEVFDRTKHLTNKKIRELFEVKPIVIYDDMSAVLSEINNEWKINAHDTDVFENTILTLVGMQEHPTVCHFDSRGDACEYPYTVQMQLGYTQEQRIDLVGKLNKFCEGLVSNDFEIDSKEVESGKLQELHLNINLLFNKILPVNGVFHRHLKEKFVNNPLLLTSYQIEAKHIPGIDFHNQIAAKLLAALGKRGALPAALTLEVPKALLNMFGISQAIIGVDSIEPAKKSEYADAEAIVLLKVNVPMESVHVFVDQLNKTFNQYACRLVGVDGNKKIIALSKQLLASDKFLDFFKASLSRPGVDLKQACIKKIPGLDWDIKHSDAKNISGILHASSPLFVNIVTRERPELPPLPNTTQQSSINAR